MNIEQTPDGTAPLASSAKRRRRRWFILAAVLLLALYLASPYYAFWRFTSALRSGDAAQLESAVDFPALRKSMKRQLTAKIASLRPQNPKRQKMFESLSDALGSRVVDSLVDAYLTPEGLAAFLANPKLPGEAPSHAAEAPPPPADAPRSGTTPLIAPETSASAQAMDRRVAWENVHYAFFTGPRDFLVDVSGTKLHFRFTGLRWRVTDLELDVSKLKI